MCSSDLQSSVREAEPLECGICVCLCMCKIICSRNLTFLSPCEELLSPYLILNPQVHRAGNQEEKMNVARGRGRTSWNTQGQAEGHRTD